MKLAVRNQYYVIIQVVLIYAFAPKCYGWQYFSRIADIPLSHSRDEPQIYHSFYSYGDCVDNKNLEHYYVEKIDHMQVLGKLIVRGWIDVKRIPTCIKLRALSHIENLMRDTAYNFQICVPRITYCHSQRRFNYYYYEWYIPLQYSAGLNWELDFYGPKNLAW